ncbi:MAG TPA: serine hydrolase domain-containing protein [Thermoanaerobaculia bacterium]|nr:serine hydrolase domain-containing protein [Thermoanaerobaculia bacterium]
MHNAGFVRRLALAVLLISTPVLGAPLGEALDTHMSRLEAFGFSGSLLVAKEGQILLNKGYGFADADRKVPFTNETAFDIGSITKQFTAAAILKLEMQGQLSVQDPISKWFEGVPEDKKTITLHHLLTHSAGLEDVFGGDYEVMPRDELVKKALGSKLLWSPGTRYRYSNAGYSLLAAIVERASGQPYESYLRENLWLPAKMTRTGYRLLEKGPLAHGVRAGKDWGTPLDHAWAPDGPWWNLRGNGGILSTTGDLYKWHQALDGEAILSKEAKAKLFTPHVPEDEEGRSHYGYGWAIFKTSRGTRLIAHNGGNGIFNADFRRYVDEGIVVIIGSNRDDFLSIPAVGPITRLIFAAEYQPPPAVSKVDPSATRRFAGSYILPTGGRLTVAAAESPSGWRGVRISPEGTDAFLLLAGGGAAEENAEREKRLMAALERSRKGEFEPLSEVFGAPLAEITDQSKSTWNRLEEKYGAFRSLELLGTVSAGGRPATWVSVHHEKGTTLIEHGWDGPTVALVRLREESPGGLFLPESDRAFVSYDPRSGAVMRLRFDPAKETLVLATTAGEVKAERGN